MALFWLFDEAWLTIERHLPANQPEARRVEDRRVISGIVHVLKLGCRWCDCPANYGPSTTTDDRFDRWSRRELWSQLFAANVLSAVTLATGVAFCLYLSLCPSAAVFLRCSPNTA